MVTKQYQINSRLLAHWVAVLTCYNSDFTHMKMYQKLHKLVHEILVPITNSRVTFKAQLKVGGDQSTILNVIYQNTLSKLWYTSKR